MPSSLLACVPVSDGPTLSLHTTPRGTAYPALTASLRAPIARAPAPSTASPPPPFADAGESGDASDAESEAVMDSDLARDFVRRLARRILVECRRSALDAVKVSRSPQTFTETSIAFAVGGDGPDPWQQ